MFGYVLPLKGEMKVKEFEAYRAYYCGVCKQLQKSYGFFSRFLLNYDLVLLALVTDALSGEACDIRREGCFANPLANRATGHNSAGLRLACDGLIFLSYHHLQDNLKDEKGLKRFSYHLARPFLHRPYRKAAARYPQLDLLFKTQMQRQITLEAAKSPLVDEACDPTAQMCAALFAEAAQNEEQRHILFRLGLFAGQIVYLLDAAEDYAEDAAAGRYNVFLQGGVSPAEAIEAAQRRCRMAAGEIALCYNLLPFTQCKAILDNIFFLGLPAGIAAAGVKRTGGTPKHGKIESV